MSDELKMHVISRADLAARRIPPTWNDPEGLTVAEAGDLHILLANPLSRDEREPARVVALLGNDVVGRVSVFPGEVSVDGQLTRVLWGRGLLVSPQHRGKGIATRVVEQWESLNATVGGVGVGPVAQRIYRKRGWAEFGMRKYILGRRGTKVAQLFLKSRALSALSAPLLDVALRTLGGLVSLRTRRAARGLSAVTCAQMSDEFDEVLRRPRARVTPHRSAAWINWLLGGDADGRSEHRLFYVRDPRNRVVGYFLIRRGLANFPGRSLSDVQVAAVKDWAVFDEQATDELSIVMLAILELLRWQADLVQVFTADPILGRRLRRLGFLPVGELPVIFHAVPPSPLAAEAYRQPDCWRIMAADGENYFSLV